MKSTLAITALLAFMLSPLTLSAANWLEREDVQAFIERMDSEHDLDRDWLESVFANVIRQDAVLEAIASPAEALPWHRYRPIFLTEARIQAGVDFWKANETVIRRASREYDVDPEMLVAIIGIETYYGRHQGRHPVLDSLVTLGFDYPPRAAFFRRELEQLFLLADEEDLDIHELRGSYAGAMGLGQFISSSWRAYAVDFSGSGNRDLLNDIEDGIGSVANYFARHNWKGGDAVAVPAILPDDRSFSVNNPLQRKRAHELRAAGLIFSEGVDDDELVLPVQLDTGNGDAWWVGLNNFWSITRYNHSPLYAMAAWELSREIAREKDGRR
ncbi:lytic murein transglycosylase B [Natronospira bacteriovora]|uniref:Lytic murein transglycosylase B n=1 Tax=Natronospira bacteriovora TaxID=3069753 RepID=A0ABU0W6Y5_9GAMM|nr:lytic murein transglycosylase B [Natronospira sp. AB-CW4]MDQ2068760.1 lytic murein transglycosylase B [Natronospira sp. AB-CW4]